MADNNTLRRVKEKLALLNTTEVPLTQVLFDLIDLVEKDEGDGAWTEKGKLYIIDQLKKEYKDTIERLTPKSKYKQQKLL